MTVYELCCLALNYMAVWLRELETVLEVSILRFFLTLPGNLTRVVEENHARN